MKIKSTEITISFHKSQIEGFIWILSIALLAFSDPYNENHFSLCLFKNSGVTNCSGCGLGHSISLLFRGEFTNSFNLHPLGLFAIFILIFRTFKIFKSHPLIKKNE